MLVKLLKNLLCLIIATVAYNAEAVFIAEADNSNYEWLTINETSSLTPVSKEDRLSNRSTLYEYEYTSRELQNDISHTYTPWQDTDEWYGNSAFDSVSVTARETNEGVNGKDSVSVRVLLLIISGLIGIFGLTKDRSHE